MYDALLAADFDNDTTIARSGSPGFQEAVDVNDDIPAMEAESDEERDVVVKSTDEELLPGIDESESWSDDPVRMYLTQMGEIPLLTRTQEITLAKKIEDTRREFRTKLLECD